MGRDAIIGFFKTAANTLGFQIEGRLVFGWNNKSAGAKVSDQAGNTRWLRVIACSKDQKNERIWYGLKMAREIKGVKKPKWFGEFEWESDNLRCRADILEIVADKSISNLPELCFEIQLSETWFAELRSSLNCLHKVTTDRIAVRQDLVTRRLHERFGQRIDAEIKEWETSHGDLHWANLTAPDCWLLDWEAWGIAPKGFDIALLYCFTLQQPTIAELIFDRFKDWLDNQDGHKARMFACAELMRMTELYSDHSNLYPLLAKEAEELSGFYDLNVSKSS